MAAPTDGKLAGATWLGWGRRASRRPAVLAVAAAGGHWVQLLRLRRALVECDVVWASTRADCRHDVPGASFRLIPDANRWDKLQAARCALAVTWLVARQRPDVVISTGALPGYFAVAVGKTLRARTIWVDSVANAEELSMSGQRAGPKADLWLTQWEHLAQPQGPHYHGSVFG